MTEAITNLLVVIVLTGGVLAFRWIMMVHRIREHRISMGAIENMTPEQIEALCAKPKVQQVPF
jgi:hypothetical protein